MLLKNRNARLRKGNLMFAMLAVMLFALMARAENAADNVSSGQKMDNMVQGDSETMPAGEGIEQNMSGGDVTPGDIAEENNTGENITGEILPENITEEIPEEPVVPDITGIVSNSGPVSEGDQITFTASCSGNNPRLIICGETVVCNPHTEGADLICGGSPPETQSSAPYTQYSPVDCTMEAASAYVGVNSGIATCCDAEGSCDTTTLLIEPWAVRPALTSNTTIKDELKSLEKRIMMRRNSKGISLKSLEKSENKHNIDIEFVAEKGGRKGRMRIAGIDNISQIDYVQTGALAESRIKNGRINTEIAVMSPVAIASAELRLPKNGDVNSIVKCDDWNADEFRCNGEWASADIPFDDTGSEIVFTVDHFSGYGGAELNIINIQSYPNILGNWTVNFTTTGTANFTIRPVEDTTWSNDNESEDLRFLVLKCGNNNINYEWADGAVFVNNYSCSETGSETSKVLTKGRHSLEFNFGGDVKYAYNYANPLLITNTVTMCGNKTDYDQVVLNGSLAVLTICNFTAANTSTGFLYLDLGQNGNFSVNMGMVQGVGRGALGGAASTSRATQGTNGNTRTAGAAMPLANGGGGGGGNVSSTSGGASGGGGAFGGAGGNGGNTTAASYNGRGGVAYGSITSIVVSTGSGGGGAAGDAASYAGQGGGAGFKVSVGIGVIQINGSVAMNGSQGDSYVGTSTTADVGTGGGGSGGHIIFVGKTINLNNAKITALGGPGGNASSTTDKCGGGGGGGGRIVIVYETLQNTSAVFFYNGGSAGNSTIANCGKLPTAGTAGTFYNDTGDFIQPAIALADPLNNTYNNSLIIAFRFTSADANTGINNCSLVLNNVLNSTNSTITNNSVAQFIFTNLTDGRYDWYINCSDNSTKFNLTDKNNINSSEARVVWIDKIAPTMTIVAPENKTSTSDTYMNFSWNATDKIGVDMLCNLTINGTVQNAAPMYKTNGTIFNLSKAGLALGDYLWNITCWDNATNTNTTPIMMFTISAPVSNKAPPNTIIVGIQDDDTDDCGNNAWDKTANTTHMNYVFGPVLNWTEGTDEDANNIKTRICIGPSKDVYLVDLHGTAAGNASTICTVLNAWQNASAIPGQWVNLTNSTFAVNSTTINSTAVTNYTYYAMFMSQDDGTPVMNGNSTNYTISVINNAPISSKTFIAASTSAAKTHSNTTSEVYKWTIATDADDGTADKCPADTLTHNATVGKNSFGDATYFTGAVAAPAGAGFSLTTGIPFNTSVNTGDNTTNSTIFAQFGACDNNGLCADRTNQTFYLYNTLPNNPTLFNITATHDQTPMVGWTNSTDKDGDNITYHIVASLSAAGAADLLSEKKSAKQGDSNFWDQVITWGTDNASSGYANDTIYIIVWATDNISSTDANGKQVNTTGYLNATFRLTDNLPDVTSVRMTDSAGYSTCPACTINPKSGSNATNIAIQVNWTDLDKDCDKNGNATVNVYLCAWQSATFNTCSEAKYNFTWLMESANNNTGTGCWGNWSINLTATNITPQFWLPNASSNEPYMLWANVSSSSGKWRTGLADNEANTTWIYSLLSSINFTTSVTLGGGTNLVMDTWNNGTTGYLMTNFGNNILNITWNASDATAPGDTLTINGTNMEIDDDNAHINGETTGMIAVNLTRPALKDFFPATTGLERCVLDSCSNTLENETMVLYWHIAPTSLIAGTYRSNITYYVTTFTP